MSNTSTAAYVTDAKDRDFTHHVLPDGVSVLPNGALLLTYERDVNGNVREGHIYAPGAWKEVNIQQEEL